MKSVLWILLLLLPALSWAEPVSDKKTLESLVEKWLDLESQKGELQSQWNARKGELDRRLELFSIEKETLQETIASANKNKTEVDKRRLSLVKDQNDLEKSQASISDAIKKVAKFAQSVKNRLPPPLQKQWSEKLPLLSQEDIGNSVKLERLLGLFKQVEEFDNRVAMNRVSMRMPVNESDGKLTRVTQIYLGVSQGWYVSDDGKNYGYGKSTKLGWKWWDGDSASEVVGEDLDAKKILQLRGILENPTTAKFISLPIQL